MKLVIFMRTDLNMSRGKIAVQSGHATAIAMRMATEETISAWFENNQTKIVLAINSYEELHQVKNRALTQGLPCYVVQDIGKTEVDPNTITCLVVGPAETKKLSKFTEGFKTLN